MTAQQLGVLITSTPQAQLLGLQLIKSETPPTREQRIAATLEMLALAKNANAIGKRIGKMTFIPIFCPEYGL